MHGELKPMEYESDSEDEKEEEESSVTGSTTQQG